MTNLQDIQYIKCLNRANLIKYLKNENFTAVADILDSKDIDGMRFLELKELDLVTWRLTSKQKRLILTCRDKILENRSTHYGQVKKVTKGNHSPQINPKFVQELESKLHLDKNPLNPKNVRNIIPSESQSIPHNSENLNEYVDMTQNQGTCSRSSFPKQEKPRFETHPFKSGSLAILPPQIPKQNIVPPKVLRKHQPENNFSIRESDSPGNGYVSMTPDKSINVNKSFLYSNKPKNVCDAHSRTNSAYYQTTESQSEDEDHYLTPKPLAKNSSLVKSTTTQHFEIDSICGNRYPPVPPRPPKKPSFTELDKEESFYEAEPHPSDISEDSEFDDGVLFENTREGSHTTGIPNLKKIRPYTPPLPKVFVSKNSSTDAVPESNDKSKQGRLPKPPVLQNNFTEGEIKLVKNLMDPNQQYLNCRFYRPINRREAKKLLGKMSEGAFVFRNSDSYDLAITIYHQHRFYDLPVLRTSDGSFYCKHDNDEKIVSFQTLEKFVEFYSVEPLTVSDDGAQINIYLMEQILDDVN